MGLFDEKGIDDYFRLIVKKIINELNNFSESKILESDSEELAEELCNKHFPAVPTLDKESMESPEIQDRIADSGRPPGRRIKVQAAIYKIPIAGGDKALLKCQPTRYNHNKPIADVYQNHIGFEVMYRGIIEGNDNAVQPIKNEANNVISLIEEYLFDLGNDCKLYEPKIKNAAIAEINKRKQMIQGRRDSRDKLKL